MEYVYAALLLHKLGKPVNEANLMKVIEAAGVQVDDAKVKTLVASLTGVDISAEMEKASTMTAAAPASAPAAKEEKKEEKQVESAAGLSALFG